MQRSKFAKLNLQSLKEKGVCSDSNQTAQLLQRTEHKSLEIISCMILNRLKSKLAAQIIANEK